MKNPKKNKRCGSREEYTVTRLVWDRMLKIHDLLQERKYPNCSTIARDFEVSLATAARDLDFMRDRWQLPIEYDRQRHGFYYREKLARLPWVRVTEADLFSVCITNKVLQCFHGLPIQKPLEKAFAKLTQNLDAEEVYMLEQFDHAFSIWMFPSEIPDFRLMELAARATVNRQGMRFTYRKPGARNTEVRSVHPYHVDAFDGRVYLQAFDPSRGAERKFALDRMSDAAVTPEAFERPKDFDPKKAFNSTLGVMSGQHDYRVLIEMDAWLTDILRGRRLHATQDIIELPGGGAHLRLRLSCLELIEQYVLGWGTHATVIEPQELRDRLFRTTGELHQRYAPTDAEIGSAGSAVQPDEPTGILPQYANCQ
jgi:proteasome accessory factor B